MATQTSGSHPSYAYVGLAGETAPGRPVKSGLYRMVNGDGNWDLATNGLPQNPAIRAITVHPQKPEIVYAGTQEGPYRSTDHGDHWEKVNVPGPDLPVWSLLYDPRDSNVMYTGYEACQIYRSDDGGLTWEQSDMGVQPQSTLFAVAMDSNKPSHMWCAASGGEIWASQDSGDSWISHPLPEGASQVYSLACG